MSYPTYTTERAQELVANYETIAERVRASAKTIDQKPVRLVAVSKLKPASDIMALYDHGVRHFGENYVQELLEKSAALPKDIQWHFIGSLQTNKCKDLAGKVHNLFALETLDSLKKAKKLEEFRSENEFPKISIFLQINTSGEENKSGFDPVNGYAEILEVAQYIQSCSKLQLRGLMTIGSVLQSKSGEENLDFRALVALSKKLEAALGLGEALELSMGMSSDFEEAIRQGATNVRVGSDIFGSRPPRN